MGIRRIAVSGGPGAGKTTLLHELSCAHAGRIVAVPEVATLMFAHVFPQVQSLSERCAVQRAIYQVQHTLESVHHGRIQDAQVLLCDRGTPDGGGYWPEGPEAFFETMQTSWDAELARYDAVIFLETAAAGGLSIATGNAVRTEDLETAVAIDRRLHAVWSRHPRFHHIPHERDFKTKLDKGLAVLRALLDGTMLRPP